MDNTTRIAGRNVPIEAGEVITVRFSSGRCGESEAGEWEFWAVYNDQECVYARCRAGADPGERFRRMEGSEGYEKFWEIARTAKAIRPAKRDEVESWLDQHLDDAKYAESYQVGSTNLRVLKTAQGFRLERQ